jgi:hypothetical protein
LKNGNHPNLYAMRQMQTLGLAGVNLGLLDAPDKSER